ncbi:MAG: DUF2179 domain-containing protein [Phycisphaeraceae bacterium]|nr:DUF2179 domain-containing protein [Phycisphaeraceae bacterium]
MNPLHQWLETYPVALLAFIYFARVTDVSIGTVRTIFVVRGHRGWAAFLGFFEVMIWLLAVSGVLTTLTVAKMLAYGLGFASGNLMGIWLEQKLAIGQQRVTLISQGRHHSVAFGLRLADYTVTEVPAHGGQGDVAMCFVIVPRAQVQQVVAIARGVDPEVFTTVEDVRQSSLRRVVSGHEATGWRSVFIKK